MLLFYCRFNHDEIEFLRRLSRFIFMQNQLHGAKLSNSNKLLTLKLEFFQMLNFG